MLATLLRLWRGLKGKECTNGFHDWDKGTLLYGNVIHQCRQCSAHYVIHGVRKDASGRQVEGKGANEA